MSTTMQSSDPDIRGSWPALRRAARKARQLALETGTPLYVLQKGKVVNLNPQGRTRRRKTG